MLNEGTTFSHTQNLTQIRKLQNFFEIVNVPKLFKIIEETKLIQHQVQQRGFLRIRNGNIFNLSKFGL